MLIVCEIRLYREGLRDGLEHRCALPVIAMASNATEALQHACTLNPELMLLDMAVPSAADLIGSVLEQRPGLKVVALGINEDSPALLNCVELGAAAYVTREASLDDLAAAIEAAARGETLCSPRMAAWLFRRVAALAQQRARDADVIGLTQREQEVLGLIDEGLSNKEIARRLRLQLATVKNHVHHILEKLGVTRRGAAAARVRNTQGGGANDSGTTWI
jgi:DNA-binding NarL/FixJ family response regulator